MRTYRFFGKLDPFAMRVAQLQSVRNRLVVSYVALLETILDAGRFLVVVPCDVGLFRGDAAMRMNSMASATRFFGPPASKGWSMPFIGSYSWSRGTYLAFSWSFSWYASIPYETPVLEAESFTGVRLRRKP
jgi:hypothetical protein